MPVITVSRAETLAIGALSQRSGVNVETIRYYERIGMLSLPPRTASGRRVYGIRDVRILAFIRRARTRFLTAGNPRTASARGTRKSHLPRSSDDCHASPRRYSRKAQRLKEARAPTVEDRGPLLRQDRA